MKTLTNKLVPFVIIALCCLLIFSVLNIKSLSNELRLTKQDKLDVIKEGKESDNQIVQLNLKIKEQNIAIENNQEIYAKLAAKLHEEIMAREALEKEIAELKQKK